MEKGKKNDLLDRQYGTSFSSTIHEVDLKYLSGMDRETFTSRKRVNKSGIK